MKRAISLFFVNTIILGLFLSQSCYSQNSNEEICKKVNFLTEQANKDFPEYRGELKSESFTETKYEFNYELGGENSRDLSYFDRNKPSVSYYFFASKSLETANKYFANFSKIIKDCLSSKYKVGKTESEYSIKYIEFIDNREDSDIKDYATIMIFLRQQKEKYYIELTFSAPLINY